MPSACGLACEICVLREKGLCPADGCVAGTDPRAPGKLERLKAATGHPCLILKCAIENNIDYCSRCARFPCDIHYQQQIFSRKILDMVKGILGKE